MDWSEWVRAIQMEPANVPGFLDENLELTDLDDEGEHTAIKQAIQNQPDNVVFIANGDREFVGYRFNNEWYLRKHTKKNS